MPILFCTTNSFVRALVAGEASLLFIGSKMTGQIPGAGSGLQPKNRASGLARMPQTAIIVPCRLDSTRFPRKLLHVIKGRPLLLWVAERIAEQAPEYPLFFAVDHALLRDCVEAAGFTAIMTSPAHQ